MVEEPTIRGQARCPLSLGSSMQDMNGHRELIRAVDSLLILLSLAVPWGRVEESSITPQLSLVQASSTGLVPSIRAPHQGRRTISFWTIKILKILMLAPPLTWTVTLGMLRRSPRLRVRFRAKALAGPHNVIGMTSMRSRLSTAQCFRKLHTWQDPINRGHQRPMERFGENWPSTNKLSGTKMFPASNKSNGGQMIPTSTGRWPTDHSDHSKRVADSPTRILTIRCVFDRQADLVSVGVARVVVYPLAARAS